MRVSLLCNESAGDGVPLRQIRNLIEQYGHELVGVVEKADGVEHLLEHSPELVVAAGGDGTVALAVRTLAHQGTPLAVLPLGTANNIAKSVGVQGALEHLVSHWQSATRISLDIGIAQGPWGRRRFVEAVGAGLIPAAIADMQTRSDGDELPRPTKLAGALRTTRHVLAKLEPVHMTIVADGVRTSGEFLLVEVLNMRSIGPNLVFSAEATPSDGVFHVVTAGEQDREQLARHLQDTLDGRRSDLSLPSMRAKHVTIEGAIDIQLDDDALGASPNHLVSIDIEAGALELLT